MLHFHCTATMDRKWNLKPQQLLHAGRPAPPRLSLKVQFAGYALAMLAALWTGSHRFALTPARPSPTFAFLGCSILPGCALLPTSPRRSLTLSSRRSSFWLAWMGLTAYGGILRPAFFWLGRAVTAYLAVLTLDMLWAAADRKRPRKCGQSPISGCPCPVHQ